GDGRSVVLIPRPPGTLDDQRAARQPSPRHVGNGRLLAELDVLGDVRVSGRWRLVVLPQQIGITQPGFCRGNRVFRSKDPVSKAETRLRGLGSLPGKVLLQLL